VYVTITESSSLGLPGDVVPSAVKLKSALDTAVGGRVVVRGGRSFATETGKMFHVNGAKKLGKS